MENVNVAIRIRPSLNILDESIGIKLLSKDPPVLYVKDRQQYMFDKIYSEDIKQKELYDEMVKPLLGKALSGYNCTVFAYGQTGTGKTYTIGSDPEIYKDEGFITRAVDEVFESQDKQKEIKVSITFFEIYNEKVLDLLSSNKTVLSVKGFQIQGLTQIKVTDSLKAREVLNAGNKHRHKGETKQNRNSSRSHAIFTIYCNVKHENLETDAKLNFVDLAGSEGVKKTGCEGSQFEEGININKGLLYLGNVINALSTNQTHIPYRSSMLTTILQDSLDKKNFIGLVACISPDSQDLNETVQTLQFAQRAKNLKIRPEIIQQYKKDNPSLFERPFLGSAVKRRHYVSLQHSVKKKPNIIQNQSWTPIKTITEPIPRISPTSKGSISPISTTSDVTPHASVSLSPLIRATVRKCTETLESRKNGFIYPSSLNTPQFSLEQYRSEITQIVKNEISQFASQKLRSPIIIVNNASPKLQKKRLEFPPESPWPEPLAQSEPNFKLPTALPRGKSKKKTLDNITTTITTQLPDDFVEASTSIEPTPRRSTRLSIRRPSSLPIEPPLIQKDFADINPASRRSSRLSIRRLPSPPIVGPSLIEKESAGIDPTLRRSSRLSIRNLPFSPVEPLSVQRRKNLRKRQLPLQPLVKSIASNETYPTPAPRKKVKEADLSPISNHNRYILNILNTGDVKELQKLPSIGPKTAVQIVFYRQLHGQFNSIADVGKMESWHGTMYQRFLNANFLKVAED